MLMDSDHAVITQYSLLNPQRGGMAHPATLVLDTEGKIRFVEINVDYSKRPPTQEVIEALQALQ